MSQTDRTQLFNNWAKDYDTAVASAEGDFPFDGYERVLDEVVSLAEVRPPMRILDLGIGTGNLAKRFLDRGCDVWGADFSVAMLAQTRARWPQINLVRTNLLDAWPAELELPFDRVVSAYVLHEFDLATKVALLRRVASHCLAINGYILVADIAFPTAVARSAASQRWADKWDEDEYYWAADEAIGACERVGLQATYKQVSSCGGVFTFALKGVG
jgi:putative AdoMet-dependent methyltransferase